jgi:hypothetical protein
MKKFIFLILSFCGVLGFVQSILAAPPDYSSVTAAVDFSTVITGILSVAALVAAVLVAMRGARLLLSVIRR